MAEPGRRVLVCGDPASSESFWSSLRACFSVKHARSIDSGGAILRQQPTSFAAILAEHSPPSLDALPLLSDPSAARLPALVACAHGEGGEVSKHASAILPKPLSSTSVSLLDEFASSSTDLLPLHAHKQSHSTCDDNLRNTCSDRHGLHAKAQRSQLSCDRSSGSNGSEGSDSKRFDDSNHGKALNGHNSDSSAETKHLDPPSQKSANTDTAGQGDSTQKAHEAHSSVPTDVPRQCSAFSAYNAAKAATRSERNEGCDSCVKPAMVMPPALTLHWHAVQALMSGEEGARGRNGTHPAFHVEHSRHGKQMEYRRTPQQRQRKVQPLERAKLQNKLKHGKQPGARRKEEHYDHDRQYKARAAALQRYRRKRMKARGPAQPPDSRDASRKGVDAEMAC